MGENPVDPTGDTIPAPGHSDDSSGGVNPTGDTVLPPPPGVPTEFTSDDAAAIAAGVVAAVAIVATAPVSVPVAAGAAAAAAAAFVITALTHEPQVLAQDEDPDRPDESTDPSEQPG